MTLGRGVPVEPGQIRRRSLLGTESLYRVLGVRQDVVRVQVIDVPRLEPGSEQYLTLDSVSKMECEAELRAVSPRERIGFRAWSSGASATATSRSLPSPSVPG